MANILRVFSNTKNVDILPLSVYIAKILLKNEVNNRYLGGK